MAERLRAVERYLHRTLGEADPEYASLRLHVWALKLTDAAVFDLTFDTAGRVGLTPAQLVSEDYAATQRAGDAYGRNDLEFPKVWRYPSAAMPGTSNFVIFGGRWMTTYDRPPAGERRIPGSLVATGASPPMELSAIMRHVGAVHAAWQAHDRGAQYALEQPLSFAIPPDEES